MSFEQNWIQIEYALPEGFEKTDYDIGEGRFKCPNCGKYEATKHSGKMIGDCNNCGQNLNFKTRKTTFVKEV